LYVALVCAPFSAFSGTRYLDSVVAGVYHKFLRHPLWSSPVANLVKRQLCCSASRLQHYQSCSRPFEVVAAIAVAIAIASLVSERMPYSTCRDYSVRLAGLHLVRLFRVRLPKASQLDQKGPVVEKQASFGRRLTVRSSEIRCSVSPWRCFGRAPLGPIEFES
jgi:hypothetical protein